MVMLSAAKHLVQRSIWRSEASGEALRSTQDEGRLSGGESVSFANYLLALSAILFVIGAVGVLVRRNALVIFMCIEMMLSAVNLTFVALSRQLQSLDGQVFVFLVMAVAAAEVAVGLAIIITLFRQKTTTNVDDINLLKG